MRGAGGTPGENEAVLAGLRDYVCRVLNALVVGEPALDLRLSPQPVHDRPVRRDPRPLRPGHRPDFP